MVEENTTEKSIPKRALWQWPVIFLILAIIGFIALREQAAAPPSATILSGTPETVANRTITVPIEVDTAGQTINVAEVYLKFDPNLIQVQSVSKDSSIFNIWIPNQPAFDNTKGEISFAAGLPNPGYKGKGKIGSVTLSAKTPVTTKLIFDMRTQALLNDGQGTVLPLKLQPIEVVIK